MTSYDDAGLKIRNNHVVISDSTKLKSKGWDALIYASVFGDRDTRIQTRWVIGETARLQGIKLASINALYKARARQLLPDDFTVPAINLRGMTYDSARAIFEVMCQAQVGAIIFELAKSEGEYTSQSPEEFATAILGAAVRTGYHGPIFLQADHVQVKAKSQGVAEEGQSIVLKKHIKRCISAGFLNIDIDASTLVDLSLSSIVAQQQANIMETASLLHFIRGQQPIGIPISIGGEIGHIGDKNSTVQDFKVFMEGLQKATLKGEEGISKVSVQTGTSHGGVVNSDGSLGKMAVDFDVLKEITAAGKAYEVGGSVQHGASTLPLADLAQFPQNHALEIHLATGWQNILFGSTHFPRQLKTQIYHSILKGKSDSKLTDAQFIYRERKRAWGAFKQETWDIREEIKEQLRREISSHAKLVFTHLNVNNTLPLVNKFALTPKFIRSIHDYQGD